VRLTKTGWAFLGGVPALAGAGTFLRWPELVLLAAAAGLALLGGTAAVLARERMTTHRAIVPERVERGAIALASLEVCNPGRRFTSRSVDAVDVVAGRSVRVRVPRLRPGRSVVRTYRLPTSARGVFPVGPLRIERSDPFGLLRRTRTVGLGDTLWVHPKVHPLPSPVSRRASAREGPVFDSAPRGRVVFHALREYDLGDDLRLVHWPSVAKTGTLMVKQHIDATEPTVAVVLDHRPASYRDEGDIEEAFDVAASVAVAALERSCSALVVVDGSVLVRGRGRNDIAALLDALAALPARSPGGAGLADDLAGVRTLRRLTQVVVVTGTAAPDLSAVTPIRAADATTVVVVGTGDEAGAPTGGGARQIGLSRAEELVSPW
jgi:uncharacterized protein (DUF58 family)